MEQDVEYKLLNAAVSELWDKSTNLDSTLSFVVQYCKTLEVAIMCNTVSIIILSIALYRTGRKTDNGRQD